MRIVGIASDGLAAVLKAQDLQPDVILSIEAARRIREVANKSRILFLGQEIDVDVAHVALTYGHGYVVTSDADNELFAAIEVVMQGEKFISLRLAADFFAV
jgi:DNA-binding NarL/FixJ family response regulator